MFLRRKNLLMILVIMTFSVIFVGFSTITAAPVASTANRGDVIFTEISISHDYDIYHQVELYNNGSSPINILNWQINKTDDYPSGDPTTESVEVAEIMVDITIPVGGYVMIFADNTTGLEYYKDFYDYGDTIILGDADGNFIDSIAYGTEGRAPGHPKILKNNTEQEFSVARVGTTGDVWNLDLTPTWGTANDVPGVDLGGAGVVINEVSTKYGDSWVELYNTLNEVVDLDDWAMTTLNDDLFVLSGDIPAHGYAVFSASDPDAPDDNPFYFSDSYGEVIYLYNDTGHRVDQMGITPNSDSYPFTWNRFPDGNSTAPFSNDGWNNATSGFVLMWPTAGLANSNQSRPDIVDIIVSDDFIASGGSVDVDVMVEWTNGTLITGTEADVTVDLDGTLTTLTYDATSEYFNGTVDFTGYSTKPDIYGFYHTTELKISAQVGEEFSNKTAGVFVDDMGYDSDDTVIMLDEAHDQMYAFTYGLYINAYWVTMLFELGIADYVVCLDYYDVVFRLTDEILTDIDLFVLTAPDSNPNTRHATVNALTTSEINTVYDFVENGGSLWLSEVGAAYSLPEENGMGDLCEKWGLEWFRGYYQDPTHNTGQDNYCIVEIPDDPDWGAFGAEEYYHNGMIVNHSEQITGVTVTEIISPRVGSNWDDIEDSDYDPDMNPIEHEYAIAYLVENGTGIAFVTGSSSLFGHYQDFEDDLESAQFALNAFCILLGIDPVQYPTLIMTDAIGSQTVTNDNSSVVFKVELTSTLGAGVTLHDAEVEGLLDVDVIIFSDTDNDGIFEGTWDATGVDAGTYTLTISASARTEEFTTGASDGARFIDTELTITVVVEEAPEDTKTKTKTKEDGGAPGFEILSVLIVFAALGIAASHIRRRE
ncbi:MAG: lamin tail domain-containing protein [Promethearchaeota archaeon]